MKKYIVIALSVGGLNKKIYNSGDIVTEEQFHPGHAEELVKQGFLKEYSENASGRGKVKGSIKES